MKNLKKMIFVTAVMMFAVLMTGCGDEKQQEIQYVYPTQQQGRTSVFQQGFQSNYVEANLYGFGGRQCSEFNNYQGYNGSNTPITGSRDFPVAGSLLQGNPEAPLRYNGLCYRTGDVRSMYERSGLPWDQYHSSPYARFRPLHDSRSSGGSYSFNHSEESNWFNNGGGAYSQGYNPYYRRRGGDNFYLEFNYDSRDRGARIEAGRGEQHGHDPFDYFMSDDFWGSSGWGY